MTPERLQQIERLYHSALERVPERRAAFLEEASGGDEELRREVQSLLQQSAEGMLNEPLWQAFDDSSLNPGALLGPYQILAILGAGGMGAVYKALDTRLNRVVAIKVSQERFSDRFKREARAIAALNHPNICTLYDVGPNYLVMELIEGESPKGPLPLEEALRIARQIVDALDAAHEKGIVHRDLKPGNIKVKPDGTIKVLDFGLAKTVELTSGDLESSPTITNSLTREGMIMGTAAYMSPEQARGKAVDKRADIWAFGVVLYELLTGHRPFHGDDLTDTLTSVMKDKPDLSRVPAQVKYLLECCLEKDATKRLRDIGDAWVAVDAAQAGETRIGGAPEHGARGRWLAWSVASALAMGLATIAFLYFHEKSPAPIPQMRFQIQSPENATQLFKLSPDGRKLALVAGGRLWVHFLESGELRDLTPEVGSAPFWSPDSRFVGYQSQGKLMKMESMGGPPQTVADFPGPWGGGAWNQDGVMVIADLQVGLLRVPATGGVPVRITALDPARQETLHFAPSFLPDGHHFLYTRRSRDERKSAVYLGSVDAKPEQQSSKPLLASNLHAECAPSADPSAGYLLFVRDGTLMAQPFDNGRMELKGQAAPVAEQVDGGSFSASANGVLVFQPSGASDRQLTWFDREGKILGTAAEPLDYRALALSPEGTRLAVTKAKGTDANLWLLDLSRGGAGTRFTFGSATDTSPVWSQDGRRIIFSSNRDGPYDLYQKPVNGEKDEVALLKSSENKYPTSWSHDGRYLLYTVTHPKTKDDIWVLSLDSENTPVPFLVTDFNEKQARFSPDGHWVAYTSDESGRPEVYVRPFSMNSAGTTVEGSGKWQISVDGYAVEPSWRGDGRELYYHREVARGRIMAVEISTKPMFRSGASQPLGIAPFGVAPWDITSDGRRFLRAATKSIQQYTVVLNWPASLRK